MATIRELWVPGKTDHIRDCAEEQSASTARKGIKLVYKKKRCCKCGGAYVLDEVARPGPRNWTPVHQFWCDRCGHGLIVVQTIPASVGASAKRRR